MAEEEAGLRQREQYVERSLNDREQMCLEQKRVENVTSAAPHYHREKALKGQLYGALCARFRMTV